MVICIPSSVGLTSLHQRGSFSSAVTVRRAVHAIPLTPRMAQKRLGKVEEAGGGPGILARLSNAEGRGVAVCDAHL
eukprot:gene14326-biopygen4480